MATSDTHATPAAPAGNGPAYTLAVNGAVDGTLTDPLDEDRIQVELTASATYDIRLAGTGPGALADPVLTLYDAAGTALARNDDADPAAGELDSFLSFTPDQTGLYTLAAGAHPGAGTGGRYRLSLTDDDDAHAATPHTVTAGAPFHGTLSDKFDTDWVRVELTAGQPYTITLQGLGADAATDTVLALLNAGGEEVAANDDVDLPAGRLDSQLTLTPDETGVYYLRAGAWTANPARDNDGRYRLALHEGDGGTGLTLTGTAGHDRHANSLNGGPGADTLNGRAGDDWLDGGAGADVLGGGPGVDTARYTYSPAGVTVDLAAGRGRGGHAGGDTLRSIEAVAGSAHADRLEGDAGPNTLAGYHGDDTLAGGGGNDWLIGGPGADTLRGGDGFDAASYALSPAGVDVRLDNGTARGGDADGDTFPGARTVQYTDSEGMIRTAAVPDIEYLDGSEHDDTLAGARGHDRLEGRGGNDALHGRQGDDRLAGEGGDDTLDGGRGNDRLEGGTGNDTLDGGPGDDTLTGGAGADTFVFAPGGGDDAVLDFRDGEDTIDLTAFDELRALADLALQQQDPHLVIDLTGHGGGTVTLHGVSAADLAESAFAFAAEDMPAIA